MVGGDERLVAAHDKALSAKPLRRPRATQQLVSALNGANEDRTTGNWIVATYRHETSRELDPQLHTHAVAANLTYDGVEGRWKALQASGLYERRAYLTEVYRNALAHEVRGSKRRIILRQGKGLRVGVYQRQRVSGARRDFIGEEEERV